MAEAYSAPQSVFHPCAQDGPVHDVQWHPSGEYFITVAGFMPAKSTLFTDACKAHYDLGSGPHNIARWSPQVKPDVGAVRPHFASEKTAQASVLCCMKVALR